MEKSRNAVILFFVLQSLTDKRAMFFPVRGKRTKKGILSGEQVSPHQLSQVEGHFQTATET